MWRAIRISLTCTLEESTERGVRSTRYVKSRFDMDHWIEVCHGPLDVEYTWKEVSISLTGNSKEGGALSFEIAKRETMI
jgi:hypothetical protein